MAALSHEEALDIILQRYFMLRSQLRDAGLEPCCGTDSEEESDESSSFDSDIEYGSDPDDIMHDLPPGTSVADSIVLTLPDGVAKDIWLTDGNGDKWRTGAKEAQMFEAPIEVVVYRREVPSLSETMWVDDRGGSWIKVTT